MRDQFARYLAEARAARNDGAPSEFQEIKATLDAYQNLAALSHSHGLVVGKYQVTKGRNGSDQILAGSRNLNASDFLTKETNLPWSAAALSMRELAFTEFLSLLIHDEVARRDNKKLSSRMRRANFRSQKTLEGFDFDRLPGLN